MISLDGKRLLNLWYLPHFGEVYASNVVVIQLTVTASVMKFISMSGF